VDFDCPEGGGAEVGGAELTTDADYFMFGASLEPLDPALSIACH
jgi:hypothetical protein